MLFHSLILPAGICSFNLYHPSPPLFHPLSSFSWIRSYIPCCIRPHNLICHSPRLLQPLNLLLCYTSSTFSLPLYIIPIPFISCPYPSMPSIFFWIDDFFIYTFKRNFSLPNNFNLQNLHSRRGFRSNLTILETIEFLQKDLLVSDVWTFPAFIV